MPKQKKTKENIFSNVYYSPNDQGALGGFKGLTSSLKSKKKHFKSSTVKKWLQSQEAYTIHKPLTKKFARRRTIVSGINDQFQADLIDMQKFKKTNSNHSYILTVIDVFSKYAWAVPLENKGGKNVANKLQKIFSQKVCRSFQTDKGREFYNSEVKHILQNKNIHHFSTENDDIKAACIERFNRTLQLKLNRWFTKTKTFKWIDVLEDLVKAYNNSYHSSIRMSPKDVSHENEEDVWIQLYSDQSTPLTKSPLKIGDVVRISKYKHVFSKGYDANWSTETFFICKVLPTVPLTYELKDRMSEKIQGTYYLKELQKVYTTNKYDVEKVISERKIDGKTQFLVKFKGYPNKFNEWVDKRNIS